MFTENPGRGQQFFVQQPVKLKPYIYIYIWVTTIHEKKNIFINNRLNFCLLLFCFCLGFFLVFLDKEQANTVISLQKRSVAAQASNMEQACMEKVCTYEEARRFFQDTYSTVGVCLLLYGLVSAPPVH